MTLPPATPAARNPLDICIDDAVSHSGVLMSDLVARARRSLYELAHRSGAGEGNTAAAQARQMLGENAAFFEESFGPALLEAMRDPAGSRASAEWEPAFSLVLDGLQEPLAGFAELASGAMGIVPARIDANPLSPHSVVCALRRVSAQTGASESVQALWMKHLCGALGRELGAEYRRLSELLRKLSRHPEIDTSAADAAQALALMESSARHEEPVVTPERAGAARRIAADIARWPEIHGVPEVVRDFVLGPWCEVIAQAEPPAGDAVDIQPSDPEGYLALVRPLFWSSQPTLGRSDIQRLLVTVPSLLSRLRTGLQSIGYPPDQAAAFFLALEDLLGIAARATGSSFAPRRAPRHLPALSGDSLPAPRQETAPVSDPAGASAAARVSPAAASQVLQPGVQLASWEGGRWVRWELTWASPKGKLLVFTTEDGDTDSMSRSGCIRRIVEQRMHVIPDIGS